MTQGLTDKETLTKLMGPKIALGYLGSPEDVTRVIVFLLSEQAAYVTGSVSRDLP